LLGIRKREGERERERKASAEKLGDFSLIA
jgi:hypothetical protein